MSGQLAARTLKVEAFPPKRKLFLKIRKRTGSLKNHKFPHSSGLDVENFKWCNMHNYATNLVDDIIQGGDGYQKFTLLRTKVL